MDSLTATFIAAVSAGVTSLATKVTKEVGSKMISDAYDTLKDSIRKKFGKDSSVIEAVEQVETEPKLESNQKKLEQKIREVKADSDKELLKLCGDLQRALQESNAGKKAMAKYQVQIINSRIGLFGDNASIQGG